MATLLKIFEKKNGLNQNLSYTQKCLKRFFIIWVRSVRKITFTWAISKSFPKTMRLMILVNNDFSWEQFRTFHLRQLKSVMKPSISRFSCFPSWFESLISRWKCFYQNWNFLSPEVPRPLNNLRPKALSFLTSQFSYKLYAMYK